MKSRNAVLWHDGGGEKYTFRKFREKACAILKILNGNLECTDARARTWKSVFATRRLVHHLPYMNGLFGTVEVR